MAGSTYRSGGEEEPRREALAGALLPGTRERLREACERGEALASAQPRWVGRPARWLLAAGVVSLGLLGPLIPSFGRIHEHPFAHQRPAQALLFAASVAGLVLGGLALRSARLCRGGLPPGIFLFASSLLEISEGRVRAWPLERLRQISQRGSEARLDLGPSGWLRLTTGEEDLADTLRRTRDRFAEAGEEHDETTLEQLDPCHHERAQSSFHPIKRSDALPTWGGAMTLRRASWCALAVVAAMVGGHVAATQVRRLSDRLGIDQSRRRHDLASLHSYLWQGGLLADEADEVWVAQLASEPDGALEEYMVLPYARRAARVDDLLAARVFERSQPLRRQDAELSDRAWRERTAGAVADLRHHLAIGRPGQPLRPGMEQNAFEMSLELDQETSCRDADEPLAPYLERSDERGEQARAARWSREMRNAVRCGRLALIESARALALTPDQQSAVASAWASYFETRRTEVMSLVNESSRTCENPELRALADTLGRWQSELWEYLGAHPEAIHHRPPARWQNGSMVPREGVAGAGREDARFLLVSDHRVHVLLDRGFNCPSLRLRDEQRSDLDALEVSAEGPRLEVSIEGSFETNGRNVITLALAIPGRAVRRARLVVSARGS